MNFAGWRRRGAAWVAAAVLLLSIAVAGPAPQPAQATPTRQAAIAALSGSQFDAGYIISDYAFFNRGAMSQAEIQSFLDERVGTCNNGNCLNVLRIKTPSKPAAAPFCNAYTGSGSGTESAAAIIYKVQVACSVSAKVILVTLQKEQSLVTSTSPSASRLERAMGYYCPDDPLRPGWCHPDYAGVFNQIYNAAKQFQRYGTGSLTWYPVGKTSHIAYHPNAACGTKAVTIKNRATAALYYYTPYTPDAAALANLRGTGGSCSTYGNRNFWVFYNDWFGSPTTLVPGGVETARLAGTNRFATSVAVSKHAYPGGAATVYIAFGRNHADALAAAPAAARDGAPLLLTESATLPASVRAEIVRLSPETIVVVGGEGAVSPAVHQALVPLAPTVRRVSGLNRYATATEIASTFVEGADLAFIASGHDFPDALTASAAAGALGAPVLLVRPTDRTPSDRLTTALAGLGTTRIVIAGGKGVVTAALQDALADLPGIQSVERHGGSNRYATADAINTFAFDAATDAFIASGRDYPDALSAAAAAGAAGGPLLLSNSICTGSTALQQLVDMEVGNVRFVGGTGVLRPTVTEFMTCG